MPAFTLSPEHDALRESVRALADDKIAPHEAKVDQSSEFPWAAHDALTKADLHAVHIPEQYGGAGAEQRPGHGPAASPLLAHSSRAPATPAACWG
ncbi:MAG: acyl-CoA dehydrogenase family protein [Streptosporangiaceae bacterium]